MTAAAGSNAVGPTAPALVTATAVSSSEIDLTWRASTGGVGGVAGYKVYRNGTQMGTTRGLSHADKGLAAFTTYSYTVAAYDTAGNTSAQSVSKSATTLAASPPSVPTGLTASAASSSLINLAWLASTGGVGGVSGYKVYRNGAQAGTTSGLTYADAGLIASTTYSYSVAAYDTAGNTSNLSAPVNATTQGVTPPSSHMRVFFSDLDSGPNAGGENNKGAYVTIWGKGFGATQGTSYVTVGAGKADNYPIWTDTKITFQLGANATTGNIAVNTSSGASNAVAFTVRSGSLYFVATNGNDGNSGFFASPFKTIVQCKNVMIAGDICYAENGVQQVTSDNYNATLSIQTGGSAGKPIALVVYPGATVTIGNSSTAYGIRTPSISGGKDYWTLSQLTILSGGAGIDLVSVSNWRVIGDNISCPKGSGQSACFHTDTTTNLSFWGNYVHDVGTTAGSIDKYYHAVYFTTNSNHIDAGWNTIVPNPTRSTKSGGCRAMQFYSTGGADQYDLHVHDNLIHDAICDGINFSTVNPTKGTVEAYNNVVYHVGTGPDPYNSSSNYACVSTDGSGSSSNVEIYNNTFYDCGSRGTSDAGAFTLYTPTRLRNNITYQLTGEVYLGANSANSPTGSNNVWWGVGAGPSQTTANIGADPLFNSTVTKDFHLQTTSPAKDAGVTISTLLDDFDGVTRPQGAAFDLGACELPRR